MDTIPEPTLQLDEFRGRVETVGTRERTENHWIARADYRTTSTSNLSFTDSAVLAELYGKQIVPHNGYGKLAMIAHMHLVASWRHAPWLEVVHDPPVGDFRHFLSIFTDPPLVDDDGRITVPEAPGLGVTIDESLVVA